MGWISGVVIAGCVVLLAAVIALSFGVFQEERNAANACYDLNGVPIQGDNRVVCIDAEAVLR